MKLPRWMVICLLVTSLLAVAAAAGSWWVTWPARTAREFQSLLIEGKWNEASRMLLYTGVDYPPDTVIAWLAGSKQDELRLEPQPWTWSDLCRGRRYFELGEERVVYFMADKGRITQWNTWRSARHY